MAELKVKLTPKTRLAPGRRGRPKATDLQALLEHVVSVAHEAFIEMGYNATTMRAIAARARISKATMYTHFGSKEDLFRAVVLAQLNSWREGNSQKNPVTVTNTLEEALKHLLMVQVRADRSPELQALMKLVETEKRLFPEFSAGLFWDAYLEGVEILAAEIRKYAAIDKIPCASPENAAELMRWTVGGGLRQIDVAGKPLTKQDQEALVERIVKFALASRASW